MYYTLIKYVLHVKWSLFVPTYQEHWRIKAGIGHGNDQRPLDHPVVDEDSHYHKAGGLTCPHLSDLGWQEALGWWAEERLEEDRFHQLCPLGNYLTSLPQVYLPASWAQ